MNNPNNLGRGHAPAVVSAPVLEALGELRYATPPQICERLQGKATLVQVQRALGNLVARDLVRHAGLVRKKGVKGGAMMSTYWLAATDPPKWFRPREDDDLWTPNRKRRNGPRFASVWDYAQGLAANDSARKAA